MTHTEKEFFAAWTATNRSLMLVDSVNEWASVQSDPSICIHKHFFPWKASKDRMIDSPDEWSTRSPKKIMLAIIHHHRKTSHYVHYVQFTSIVHSNLLHSLPFSLQRVTVVWCRLQLKKRRYWVWYDKSSLTHSISIENITLGVTHTHIVEKQ